MNTPSAEGITKAQADCSREEILRSAISARGWEVKTLRDAIESPTQEPPWIIEGLVLGESGTLISALPKRMKSLTWLQACLEAPAYHKVWGRFAALNVKRTLFIETEDPAWLVEARIRGLRKGLDIPVDLPGFNYVCPGPFDLLQTGSQVIPQVFDLYRPDLMVLSTLQNLIPGRGTGDQKEMQPVLAEVLKMARKHCPIVLLTHSPQDEKKRRAAGSVTIAANFVIEGHYKAPSAGPRVIHVQLHSKAGAGATDFTLELETEGADSDPSAVRRIICTGDGQRQNRSEVASLLLATRPDMTAEEIMGETGLGKSAAYAVIQRFRHNGKNTGKRGS